MTSLVSFSVVDIWYSVTVLICVLQAEVRLAARWAARAEAQEIRMKELERQQKEVSRLFF